MLSGISLLHLPVNFGFERVLILLGRKPSELITDNNPKLNIDDSFSPKKGVNS
jgi:hypothetical protein